MGWDRAMLSDRQRTLIALQLADYNQRAGRLHWQFAHIVSEVRPAKQMAESLAGHFVLSLSGTAYG